MTQEEIQWSELRAGEHSQHDITIPLEIKRKNTLTNTQISALEFLLLTPSLISHQDSVLPHYENTLTQRSNFQIFRQRKKTENKNKNAKTDRQTDIHTRFDSFSARDQPLFLLVTWRTARSDRASAMNKLVLLAGMPCFLQRCCKRRRGSSL